MALGSTPALTEINTRVICWGVKAAGARDDNFATFICAVSRNDGILNLLEP
jgi:hypothetical protein